MTARLADESPILLFARLELAVERGDFATAAEVQRELGRRGIQVNYGRPAPGGGARTKSRATPIVGGTA
jgi:hypothetical protein